MPKERVPPPKAVRDAVMDEFNHKCAICGKERPQVHHIDEDPSNNDPLNLIPLCPNHHLIDLHNPTGMVAPGKIRLFRKYKDPTILTPQFHVLFVRMEFLDHVEDGHNIQALHRRADELAEFVANLEMGSFYSNQLGKLLKLPALRVSGSGVPDPMQEAAIRQAREYREQLHAVRERVIDLIVELLRFQKWDHSNLGTSGS